jgi:uncharacterized damage-inducible protein DinB
MIETPAGYDPQVGLRIGAMEDTRRRTKEALEGVSPEVLNWAGVGNPNSIATLLYHIAAIEMDWLYIDILGQSNIPPEVTSLLPYDVRDDEGLLVAVQGASLRAHMDRFDATRKALLSELMGLRVGDLGTVRHLPDYDVTPEWVLHHLMQHEAEHRGQIMEVRTLAERASSPT